MTQTAYPDLAITIENTTPGALLPTRVRVQDGVLVAHGPDRPSDIAALLRAVVVLVEVLNGMGQENILILPAAARPLPPDDPA